MLSSTEFTGPGEPVTAPSARGALQLWTRKLHTYSGLYFLVFLWLFAFTGLLLNHSQWKFAQFWDSRQQSTVEQNIVAPAAQDDLARARDLMRQLGLRGEIEWTATSSDPGRLDFRVSRPGTILEIKADLAKGKASVQRIKLNAWGVLRILHSFTGVRLDDARNARDWALTSLWALAMDAVAAGLILMVFSGLYMWYEARQNRLLGGIVLLLGALTCGLFCVGLRWLY